MGVEVHMRSLVVLVPLAVAVVVGALGCEPEIGGLCDPDPAKVAKAIDVKKGTNNLVQDVELDNCSEGFCLSSGGSRPFCTKKCEADSDCTEAGPGFTCQVVLFFGPLACDDFEDPTKPRKGTTPSNTACAGDGDCTVTDERCVGADGSANPPVEGKCFVPGRDCLTGADKGPSTLPKKYCSASPDVIAKRDKAFGR